MQSDVRRAALQVLASLTANEDQVRKQVLELDGLTDQVVAGLTSSQAGLRLAALKCLHSLSRSAQQLKQQVSELSLWPPLKQMIDDSNVAVSLLASSSLCNLMADLAPG